jgi:flagellar export protein FliJ
LVRHRERLEHLQEAELAEANHLLAVRRGALHEAHDLRQRAVDTPVPGRGPVDPADLLLCTVYLARAERDIDARRAAVLHSEADVAEELASLLERRRDRKAMETLLGRRIEQERIERNRADINRIDELAVNRWRPPGGRP